MAAAATAPVEVIGKNVTAEREGSVLVLRIDTAKTQGRSKSGKSEIIATTSGATKLAGFAVNLNVYK